MKTLFTFLTEKKNLLWTNKKFVYLNIITNFCPTVTSENIVPTTWKGLKKRKFRENKIVDSWIQESWKHVMSLTIVWHSGQNFHKTIWSSSSGLVMLSFRSCMISVMLVLPEKVIHVEFEVHLKRFLKKVKL